MCGFPPVSGFTSGFGWLVPHVSHLCPCVHRGTENLHRLALFFCRISCLFWGPYVAEGRTFLLCGSSHEGCQHRELGEEQNGPFSNQGWEEWSNTGRERDKKWRLGGRRVSSGKLQRWEELASLWKPKNHRRTPERNLNIHVRSLNISLSFSNIVIHNFELIPVVRGRITLWIIHRFTTENYRLSLTPEVRVRVTNLPAYILKNIQTLFNKTRDWISEAVTVWPPQKPGWGC